MSAIADQLLALARNTGAPDVVEDAAILIRSLEGVRAERDVLQEIVDEQRAQIAKLVERIVELTEEVASVTEDRRHAVAALSEQVDKAIAEIKRLRQENATLTAERDEARQEVCFLLSRNVTQGCDGDTPEFHATARGWCYLLEEDTNG